MKPVVPCPSCALCGVRRSAGFVSEERLWCTRAAEEVTPEDGCTLGEEGEPRQAVEPVEVDLPWCRDPW